MHFTRENYISPIQYTLKKCQRGSPYFTGHNQSWPAMLAALHCIKVVLCCSALPIPHTEIPKQSCAAFASSKASARVRGRQGERGWGEQSTRDGVLFSPKKIFSPEILSLSLFRYQTEPQYKQIGLFSDDNVFCLSTTLCGLSDFLLCSYSLPPSHFSFSLPACRLAQPTINPPFSYFPNAFQSAQTPKTVS